MNVDEVVQLLKHERSRLDAAIQALEATDRRSRPRGGTSKSAKRPPMSAAARKRISLAMKRRWAKRRRKTQK